MDRNRWRWQRTTLKLSAWAVAAFLHPAMLIHATEPVEIVQTEPDAPADEGRASKGGAAADLQQEAVFPIDLPTALRLADAQNPQVAFARERVQQARAQQNAAGILWLPTIRAGATVAQHDGVLQDSTGRVIDVNRNSQQVGLGAAAFGAGPPMIPGVSADFHMADAIFQPLAARRMTQARQAASAAVANDLLFDVARTFLEWQRAHGDVAIADEATRNTRRLRDLTQAYARSGEGLQSDAHRVEADESLRANEVARARELSLLVAARLVRLLHLDPAVQLVPVDSAPIVLELVSAQPTLSERITLALGNRPELRENEHLVGEAQARLQRERYAPLMPTVAAGVSYGGFGGSGNAGRYNFSDRTDFQAMAYWQLRNLGLGDRAAQKDRQSQVRQACLRKQIAVDMVSQEVAEAHAQLQYRFMQIATAEQGVNVATASYRLNLERIEGSQGLPIEVLQSIQALAQARREYLRAVTDYNIAQFAMQRATGLFLANP